MRTANMQAGKQQCQAALQCPSCQRKVGYFQKSENGMIREYFVTGIFAPHVKHKYTPIFVSTITSHV